MALDYSIIGERLKKARLAKNMTQENLAEQLDVQARPRRARRDHREPQPVRRHRRLRVRRTAPRRRA